jgi:hypothetical protein
MVSRISTGVRTWSLLYSGVEEEAVVEEDSKIKEGQIDVLDEEMTSDLYDKVRSMPERRKKKTTYVSKSILNLVFHSGS